MPYPLFECGFKRNPCCYYPYTERINVRTEADVAYLTDPWRNSSTQYFKTEKEARKWYREAIKNGDDMSYEQFCDFYGLIL